MTRPLNTVSASSWYLPRPSSALSWDGSGLLPSTESIMIASGHGASRVISEPNPTSPIDIDARRLYGFR